MRECGKVLFIDFDKLSQQGGKQFSFPRPRLRRRSVTGVENCLLLVVISALKSQRRVRCEFGVICFLEIDFALREIN